MPSTPAAAVSRDSTFGEEIANSVSHGLGLLLAIAGLPVLVIGALRDGGTMAVVAAAVFGGSAILLYLASTLYHAVAHVRIKAALQRLDHAAIYLLIAGTYTPIALGVLRGGWGWTMLGVIWSFAVLGVVFKLVVGARFHRVSTALYVAMGWAALAAIRPLWQHMPPGGLAWLFGGGLAYTLGVLFFLLHERLRYSHFIWHLCVLAGTGCHYVAVLRYAF
ncbi:hemolysin D [Rhodanobacter sp. FW510-R12]|uniref:PAQR family membrane homeostasis protein TrhA n=1 Tax=unclassified Rhodanobacter TaxID=2621553 RepID=UPI0007A9A0A6|nr:MULTISPECIES: hemolysin III family protein [unclassified Rhodanobacter]KZC15388.1 hemolysin D [Rhodanobacter sp. FW104-R8]KZC25523.1 hemolysin D [Rhodanobacter sp. FW510-T8]KZC31112.1 hemolysin D [Rhodanobacter sp. FW510-R10]